MPRCSKCQAEYENMPAFCGVCGNSLEINPDISTLASDPLIGVIIDGRYRIVDLIGRGGMGAVYQVEHVKMGKLMAMKILHGKLSRDSDIIRRFKREARTVSKLEHINTVSVFDFGSYSNMMYLVMEYINGSDLSTVVRVDGPLTLLRLGKIIIQVCSSLKESHEKNIIHRDLKPENILVFNTPEEPDFVKVLDFGLARFTTSMQENNRLTAKGSIVGTPYYMAPEHIRDESVDTRLDIYSLGAVMYKLVTGETPFTANTPMGVITKHLTEEVEPPSKRFPRLKIPGALDDVILKAMMKDPSDRYQTIEEMRTAIADVCEMEGFTNEFKRFSSSGMPSWHAGELKKPISKEWKNAATCQTVAAGKGDKLFMKNPDMAKSVIIGAKEITLGTKSDFISFENSLKRKRMIVSVSAILLFVLISLFVVMQFFTTSRDTSIPEKETEPNNDIPSADLLADGTWLDGFIFSSDDSGDVDWYRIKNPGAGSFVFELELKGTKGLNLAMQVLEPGKKEPLAIVNENSAGHGEIIPIIHLSGADAYILVQEIRAPGIPPGKFPDTPYKLRYKLLDPDAVEREPNNSISTATPLQTAKLVKGILSDKDIDWYCLPAGTTVKSATLTSLDNVSLMLTVRNPLEQNSKIIDEPSSAKTLVAQLDLQGNPVCLGVSVSQKSNDNKDAGVTPTSPTSVYTIIAQ